MLLHGCKHCRTPRWLFAKSLGVRARLMWLLKIFARAKERGGHRQARSVLLATLSKAHQTQALGPPPVVLISNH